VTLLNLRDLLAHKSFIFSVGFRGKTKKSQALSEAPDFRTWALASATTFVTVAASHLRGGIAMPTKKKSTAKKSFAKKKSSGRKYGPKASASVEREMKAMKQGKLKSGHSGKKVTNPKQAIAIGLSEARKSGAKVPPAKKKSST
jgi:hypothetical protein